MIKEIGQKIHTKTTMSLVRLVGVLLKMHPAFKTETGRLQLAIGFLNNLDLQEIVKILLKNSKNSAKETHTLMREKIKQKFLH